MFRTEMTALALLLFLSLGARSQEAETDGKATKIRDEITKLQAQIRKLESELSDLDDKAVKSLHVGPRKSQLSREFVLTIGDRGHFGPDLYKVVEVIDDKTVRMRYGPTFTFIVKGVDTAPLVDDLFVHMRDVWAITGTTRIGGSKLYIVEPKHSGNLEQPKR